MLRLLALLCILVLIAGIGCSSPLDRTEELNEFRSSYPAEARPNGVVKTFDLVAAPTELPLVDGTKMRVWAYNGRIPGPTLRVRLGETVRVRFKNRLPQETTIHWHGVRVPNGMDGVPHATQPPIASGGAFVYEFTPKDAGTFWYHPHIRASEQVERGLYGVLIVEDPKPSPFSRDVLWVMDDWLRDKSGQVVEEFNTMHDLMHDGRWGNTITINSQIKPTLEVKSGERVRLRLLNSANGRVFRPDFTGLKAKVIAIDGMYLREPIDPVNLEIAPGNRVDLDVSFSDSKQTRIPISDRFDELRPGPLADILVKGIAVPPPASPTLAKAHVPRWAGALATPVDQEFRLKARRGGPLGLEWTINDEAFTGDHDQCSTVTFKQGSFQHLRFTNESHRLHPIHLHGMFFRLLARDGQPVNEPFFRDTVVVHAKETLDVGLVPVDAGRWMMHCHILEHAEAGMMMMIDVKP